MRLILCACLVVLTSAAAQELGTSAISAELHAAMIEKNTALCPRNEVEFMLSRKTACKAIPSWPHGSADKSQRTNWEKKTAYPKSNGNRSTGSWSRDCDVSVTHVPTLQL
jgi:hypothetical protein